MCKAVVPPRSYTFDVVRMSTGIRPEFLACTVVIPTRDRPQELHRCLEAVSRLAYQRFDVIVVDSAPRRSPAEDVAERWGARYVLEPRPGASRARNRGARESTADVVAFVEDEEVPEREWLNALVPEFADPLVMAVVGRVLALPAETNARRLFERAMGFDGGPTKRVVDRSTADWFARANFGGIGNGGNMAFRRTAFDVWPGFNERLGPGTPLLNDEHYAFFSLIERGYRVVYTPDAVVRHPVPTPIERIQQRELMQAAASTAYMTFLLVEEPRYRSDVLSFAFERIRRREPHWRRPSAEGSPGLVPSWRRAVASLSGPLLYGRARVVTRRAEGGPFSISIYHRIRERLGRVPSLKSGWYLLHEIKRVLLDRPEAIRDRFDREFRARFDPWNYSRPAEQDRFQRALALIDLVAQGKRFERVLEVGCAEGMFTVLLAPRCNSLLAVDVSPVALMRARRRCHEFAHVSFREWNLRLDAPPGMFELVTVMDVLEAFARPGDLKAIRRRIPQVVARGGYLLMSSTRDNPWVENAFWGRWLIRGAHINRYFASHPALAVRAESLTDSHAITLMQRVR